jgi:hypothetical protein
VVHVSGNCFNIRSMLIYFLININVHTWKKWQYKVFIYCCSINCYGNLFAVNYTLYKIIIFNKRRLVSHWPPAFTCEIGMLLITTFVELRLDTRKKPNGGRSPTCHFSTADVNSHMPCHANAASMPCCAVALSSRFQNDMVVALHGRGMDMVLHVWIKHGLTVWITCERHNLNS